MSIILSDRLCMSDVCSYLYSWKKVKWNTKVKIIQNRIILQRRLRQSMPAGSFSNN